MTDLSIFMPSNRNYSDSRSSIESAMTYTKLRDGSELCVCDNSGDFNKSSQLTAFKSHSFQFIEAPGTSGSENFLKAMNSTNGRYIHRLDDDDHILSTGNSIKYEFDKKIAGYAPNFIIWDKGKGIIQTKSRGIKDLKAKDRINSYMQIANGNNVTFYSAISRSLSLDINNTIFNLHPIKGGYWDWAITLAYVSSGVLLEDHSTLHVYNLENWRDGEQINKGISKIFSGVGSGNRGHLFLRLLLAIDSFLLIARNTSPINRDEASEAAQFAFAKYCTSFMQLYEKNKKNFLPAEIESIEKIHTNHGGFLGLLHWALNIVEIFEPSIINQYKVFYFACLEKKWGDL